MPPHSSAPRFTPVGRSQLFACMLSLFVLDASCATDDAVKGLSLPVDRNGPFAVGYRELSLTYDPPDGGPPRTIPVAMWYPADPVATAALPSPEYAVYLVNPSTVAVIDAPPAAPAYPGGYPVIVHSHGHWAYENHNFNIGESLSTLGYVVVAPGHVGDRIFDLNTMVPAVDDFYERVYDIRATLDLLENLPANDAFRGRCNTTRVVMTGHSRGTSTVWGAIGATVDPQYIAAQCAAGTWDASGGCPAAKVAVYDRPMRDPRIVGGVPMAGDGDNFYFGGYPGMNVVTTPVMMMSASANLVGDAEILAAVTTPPMFWIEFAGGCHDLFGAGLCGPTEIDHDPAIHAINVYIHAFARRHIFDDQRPETTEILDGTRSVSSLVTYRGR